MEVRVKKGKRGEVWSNGKIDSQINYLKDSVRESGLHLSASKLTWWHSANYSR
jgi:hypothetical protein